MTDRLWAPWRMEYILGRREPGCIFCDFGAADREQHRAKLVLAVTAHALVCLNKYPFAAGHLLVAPRRHVSDLDDLPAEEYDETMRLLRVTAARLREATRAEGLNVGFNLGKSAGAGIEEHLHGHVVPRWAGDSNFMPVIGEVRVMPEHLDDSWQRLAPFFADISDARPAG